MEIEPSRAVANPPPFVKSKIQRSEGGVCYEQECTKVCWDAATFIIPGHVARVGFPLFPFLSTQCVSKTSEFPGALRAPDPHCIPLSVSPLHFQ